MWYLKAFCYSHLMKLKWSWSFKSEHSPVVLWLSLASSAATEPLLGFSVIVFCYWSLMNCGSNDLSLLKRHKMCFLGFKHGIGVKPFSFFHFQVVYRFPSQVSSKFGIWLQPASDLLWYSRFVHCIKSHSGSVSYLRMEEHYKHIR